MARARNIKPGFFKNEDLAECSPFARLCFAGLWTLADREGRLEDRPKRIKGDLFAFDSIEVEPLLRELVRWRFISRYVVGDMAVIQILKFSDHQTPHFKEVQSALPPDPNPGLAPDSTNKKPKALHPLNEHQAQDKPETGPQLNGGSKPPESGFLIPDSRSPLPPVRGGPSFPGFDRFWAAWPRSERKEARGKCLDAWRKAKAEDIADEVIAHVEAKKATDTWQKDGGRFIEAPLVYLNQRRWEGAGGFAEVGGDDWTRSAL